MSPLITALRAAGNSPSLPFTLPLPEQGELHFRQLLRLLPGKRLAGLAEWNGQPVFAKLFIAPGAHRQGQREASGLQLLHQHGLPTPPVLLALALPDAYLILTAWLEGALSLDKSDTNTDIDTTRRSFALLGQLHAAGLVHTDLHDGNFLDHAGRLYLIDGDGVAIAANPSALRQNLALLLSQLPVAEPALQAEALSAYAHTVDAVQLTAALEQQRTRRLRHFLGKTVRDCTAFVVARTAHRFTACVREMADTLAPLLVAPDVACAQGERLKDGNSSTVARWQQHGLNLVIKRYNLKSPLHALARAPRMSRAWRSWQSAHMLAFFGLATPRPLALIEERWGPLRRRAWLVCAHQEGAALLACLAPDAEPPPALAAALKQYFQQLHALRITHGDLKATNLLWDGSTLFLIDLDGLRRHRSARTFQSAWQRDRTRFLRNWAKNTVLHAWLENNLPR